MNPMDTSRPPQPQKTNLTTPLAIGFGAFTVGVGLTFGYLQWQAQQQQLDKMTEMVAQMQQDQQQRQAEPETVTRNAPVDLLSVTAAAIAATPEPATPIVTPTPAAAPAPAATSKDDTARTTADRIRALVARSSDPLVSAAIAQDVARRETMSVAIQGVNELVAAAVLGGYALSTDGKGRLRIAFPGREEDQRALEKLLSSAAEAGMIAFSDSVRGSDGSFDGRILLFDLVERALLNGTKEEKRVGADIRRKALELTAQTNSARAVPQSTTGEKFYTVEPGDSLAYIALQFYGNTNAYLKIFQANRKILSSPEKIQIGQKLLIPTI